MSEIIYFKNKPPDDVSWLREAIMEMEMRDAALQFMTTARYAVHTDVNHFPREDGSAECIINIGNAHGEGLSLTVIDGSD